MSKFSKILYFFVLAVSILSACLNPSFDNFIAVFLTLVSLYIGLSYFFNEINLKNFPISTLSGSGFVFCYLILPTLVTLLDLNPLTNNLNNPVLVFINILVFLLILIFSHIVYKKIIFFLRARDFLINNIGKHFSLYKVPTFSQAIIIGIFSFILILSTFGGAFDDNHSTSSAVKFASGFYPFVYLPLIFFAHKVLGLDQFYFTKVKKITLFFYSFIFIYLAIFQNSRSSLFFGFFSILLLFFYGLNIKVYNLNNKELRKKSFIFFLLVLICYIPVSRLSNSMIMNRDNRSYLSSTELINETILGAFDSNALDSFTESQEQKKVENTLWDEDYVSNAFLSRLCNLKYLDNTIDLALTLDKSQRQILLNLEIDRIVYTFPQPLLNFLNVKFVKTNSGSGGDIILYASTNDETVLGGYRTGSLIGNSLALFGITYPLVLFIICLFTFPIMDSLCYPKQDSLGKKTYFISPFAALNSYVWFAYFTSAATGVESFGSLFTLMLRGYIQIIFIYYISYNSTKFFRLGN